jgi:hypothetical protein
MSSLSSASRFSTSFLSFMCSSSREKGVCRFFSCYLR